MNILPFKNNQQHILILKNILKPLVIAVACEKIAGCLIKPIEDINYWMRGNQYSIRSTRLTMMNLADMCLSVYR